MTSYSHILTPQNNKILFSLHIANPEISGNPVVVRHVDHGLCMVHTETTSSQKVAELNTGMVESMSWQQHKM